MTQRAAVVAVVASVWVGCTARNPDACCTNAVDCERIGFDEVTPCLDLRVCVDNECVTPQCTQSSECTTPTPYCVNNLCTAECIDDNSCVGTQEGAHCSVDGACVECIASTDCPEDSPVCDAATSDCRGCAADDECSSGICLASEGTCASADDAVWVAMDGADVGECTASAQCATVGYALAKISASRRVLRISSLDFVATGGIVLDRDVYLDTAGTRVQREPSSEPILQVNNNAMVTIEGIRLIAGTQPSLLVERGANVLVYDAVIEDNSNLSVDSTVATSELRFVHGEVTNSFVECVHDGVLVVSDSVLDTGKVVASACDLTVRRNHFRFQLGGTAITVDQLPPVTIENNVFEAASSTQSRFLGLASTFGSPGSLALVRFNTMINTTPGTPLNQVTCAGTIAPVLSSNIFVAGSPGLLVGTPCVVDHSLFDDATGAPPGTGNITAPAGSIFVDAASGDYRPTQASGALGAADPAQAIDEDYSGNPRPAPAGSVADIGAFEVP